MKTFTAVNPKLRGYTFSDAGIVWSENGIRKKVLTSSLGEYVLVRNQRFYIKDLYDQAVAEGKL